MKLNHQQTVPWILLLASLVFMGCGPQNQLGRKPVAGTIQLDGAPLPAGSISFTPQSAGVSSGAEIVAGQYSIAAERGLTPGTYIVRIYSTDETSAAVEPTIPGPGIKVQPERVPAVYNLKSQLEVVVTETDREVTFDLEMNSSDQ